MRGQHKKEENWEELQVKGGRKGCPAKGDHPQDSANPVNKLLPNLEHGSLKIKEKQNKSLATIK